MKTITLIVVVGLLVFKCSSKKTDSIDQVSGTYVREFSYKVVHPETGLEIGIRTIRDTIFIKPAGDKFEVSNHKWMNSDYDDVGWKVWNMATTDHFLRILPNSKSVITH